MYADYLFSVYAQGIYWMYSAYMLTYTLDVFADVYMQNIQLKY